MRLFKAFRKTDRGLQTHFGDEIYEIGKTYTLEDDKELVLGKWGYHGCPIPLNCCEYFNTSPHIALTEVEVHEDKGIVTGSPADNYLGCGRLWNRIHTDKACFRSFTLIKEIDIATIEGCFRDFGDTVAYYKEGKLHREDGPALRRFDGKKSWYKEGKLHREGGPAVTNPDGETWWYRNGMVHRDDGPAVVRHDYKAWFRDDRILAEEGNADHD